MTLIKKYRPNFILALVVMLMIAAGIFSIDIDKLLTFYTNIQLTGLLFVAFVIMPVLLFFGFSVQLFEDRIISQSNLFFRKAFSINDLSHVLYQPTWRGVTPMTSNTNMRSLYIIRHSGGRRDTISLTNGAYKEEDLADIVKRLQHINPRIELDEWTQKLIKKYE